MRVKKANSIAHSAGLRTTDDAMRQILKKYGVVTPHQLKMKLLWLHVIEILRMQIQPSEQNKIMIGHARYEWDMADIADNRMQRSRKK